MTTSSNVSSVNIRPFTEQDVDQVSDIEKLLAPDPWSRDLFVGEFEVPAASRFWLVAENDSSRAVPGGRDGSSIVGFGGLMFATDEAHIMNMGVTPLAQQQGVARRLLASLLLEAIDRGSTAATLEVRSSNTAAIGLYERFRFEAAGTRPGYYQDGEDATIMWAHRIYHYRYIEMLKVAQGSV